MHLTIPDLFLSQGEIVMLMVSKLARSEYLQTTHPILFKLCVAYPVPSILEFRCNTALPWSDEGSLIPAAWDTDEVKVIPLWEGGSTLTAIRVSSDEEFIQINYEDPNDLLVIAKSVDGLFTYLFYFLVESAGGKEAEGFNEIEELASYLRFDKLDIVMELIRRLYGKPDYESLSAFTRSV
jgi:hypothetical protein